MEPAKKKQTQQSTLFSFFKKKTETPVESGSNKEKSPKKDISQDKAEQPQKAQEEERMDIDNDEEESPITIKKVRISACSQCRA